MSRLYWAYGSNLCHASMLRRCPQAIPVGPLYLDRARLVFRSVADVVRSERGRAAGGLWVLSPEDEQTLDRYEGVGSGLYSKRTISLDWKKPLPGGLEPGRHSVLLYTMNENGVMPPPEPYLETIIQGYRDFGLDQRLLKRAVDHSWKNRRRTPYLDWRVHNRGNPRLGRMSAGWQKGDRVWSEAYCQMGRVRSVRRDGLVRVEWTGPWESFELAGSLSRVEEKAQ